MKKKFLFLTSLFLLGSMLPTFAISEPPYNKELPKGGIQEAPLKEDIYIDNDTYKLYKKVSKDDKIIQALEIMKGGLSDYSRRAILGKI